MRKPLIVLSVVCTLKGTCWDGWYKRSKAIILCIVYAMLFVNSVDMYIQWKLLGWLPYVIAYRMQHASTVSTYPGSCKTFSAYQFLWEKFHNISNDWPKSWLTAYLHISLFDLVNPLIFANSCPGWHNYSLGGLLFQFYSQLTLKISLSKDVFWHSVSTKDIFRTKLPMPQSSVMEVL